MRFYVGDILVVCRCIQTKSLTFELKMFVKSVFPKHKRQFIGKIVAYEQSNFHLQTIQFAF